jgi:integrase
VYLGDGDPARAWIKIREGAKNDYRVRSIPLDREAFEAASRLNELARERGAGNPEHYLIPFVLKRNHYDPTRCQTTFKKAWREMCAAADIEGLRMYDMRHHASRASGAQNRRPCIPANAQQGLLARP